MATKFPFRASFQGENPLASQWLAMLIGDGLDVDFSGGPRSVAARIGLVEGSKVGLGSVAARMACQGGLGYGRGYVKLHFGGLAKAGNKRGVSDYV